MERREIVIDASVAVKWFVEEEYSDLAIRLKDLHVKGEIDLAAPSLIYYEVLNALRYSGVFKPEELGLIVRSMEDLQILLYPPSSTVMSRAVELSLRYGITVYDASYLSLAEHLNTVVYTADEKLLRRVSGFKRAIHIKDLA